MTPSTSPARVRIAASNNSCPAFSNPSPISARFQLPLVQITDPARIPRPPNAGGGSSIAAGAAVRPRRARMMRRSATPARSRRCRDRPTVRPARPAAFGSVNLRPGSGKRYGIGRRHRSRWRRTGSEDVRTSMLSRVSPMREIEPFDRERICFGLTLPVHRPLRVPQRRRRGGCPISVDVEECAPDFSCGTSRPVLHGRRLSLPAIREIGAVKVAHQAASLLAARRSSAALASLVMRRMISPAGRISPMLPALCPAVRQACSMSPLKSRVGRMAL